MWSLLALLMTLLPQQPAAPAAVRPLRLAAGPLTYVWETDWPRLAAGEELGPTHGQVVVDSKGRIYASTDTERAVLVFAADGALLRSFGKELAGGLHGLALGRDAEHGEFLYLAHTARHEVLLATLEGEVFRTIPYPREAGIYEGATAYRPTGVAVLAGGSFYVADGYGGSFVHRYDEKGNYVRSCGGPGSEPGRMRVPHGIWIDTRVAPARLVVADRENHRLQWFALDDDRLLGVLEGFRQPCDVRQWRDYLVVPELGGRVTLVGKDDAIVARLGDQPDEALRAQFAVGRERWRPGEFLSPHGAAFDAEGNLYVQDWNQSGRLTRLTRLDG